MLSAWSMADRRSSSKVLGSGEWPLHEQQTANTQEPYEQQGCQRQPCRLAMQAA